jgi:FkbM family methyltransferase
VPLQINTVMNGSSPTLMKTYIKTIASTLVRPLANRLGLLNAVSEVSTDHLDCLISIIHGSDFDPKLIIDVGANHGGWTRKWKNTFPHASYILVEPQKWLLPSFSDLLDPKTKYLPIGAGKHDGTLMFTVNTTRDDSSTFLLTADEALSCGYSQVEIPVRTLNSIVLESGWGVPDIVKIDAEGLDIDVLQGATDLFGKTEVFFVEANINGSFTQTTLIQVINFMDSLGYRVFDITDINRPWSNRLLWLIELAFVRKNGFFDTKKWM